MGPSEEDFDSPFGLDKNGNIVVNEEMNDYIEDIQASEPPEGDSGHDYEL
jgi:hypothetical protein